MDELILIQDDQATLRLDLVDAESRLPSSCFNVHFIWQMPHEQIEMKRKEVWFEDCTLEEFERSLTEMTEGKKDEIALQDMSQRPLISIAKNDEGIKIRIHSKDLSDMGEMLFEWPAYPQEIEEIRTRLKDYPAWWRSQQVSGHNAGGCAPST